MKARKFLTYTRLAQELRRQKQPNYGKLATFLLIAFRIRKGIIRALDAETAGLCLDGGFTYFRNRLIELGWLKGNLEKAQFTKKFDLFEPGYRLIPYLEEEEAYQGGLPKTLKELQEKFTPNEVYEKVCKQLQITEELLQQYKTQYEE